MAELKTLKDFGREREIYDMDTGRLKGWDRVLYFNDVKQGAIEHYKAVKNGDLVIDVLTYIRWANDLTEEDLKNSHVMTSKN